MNVSVTAEMERLVARQVKSGRYHTASEVVRDALRLFEEREEYRRAKIEDLRREVDKGLDELDRREGIPADAVFRELRQRPKRRKKSA